MSSGSTRAEQLEQLGRQVTDRPHLPFCVPGLAVVVASRSGPTTRIFLGTDGAGNPIDENTLFPLASATKLALGLAVLNLFDQGAFALDDPLSKFLPQAAAARSGVTVRSLLSHTSGLASDVDAITAPITRTLDWARIKIACLRTPLAFEPGAMVHYSNSGYGLLALIIEHVTGSDFRVVVTKDVLGPLGIEGYIGQSLPRQPAVIVDVNSPYVGTDLEPYNSEFWWQLGTPWAGLYSTGDGLLSLVRAYAEFEPTVIGASTMSEARRDQTAGASGGFGSDAPLGFNPAKPIRWSCCSWGLAVERRGEKRPHWTPPSAAPASFGHIGASGCLAWYDPDQGVAWAILAPRTTDNAWLLRHGPAFGRIALTGS
jgi:CubicO group peptidase (beta-lactamase class C family)